LGISGIAFFWLGEYVPSGQLLPSIAADGAGMWIGLFTLVFCMACTDLNTTLRFNGRILPTLHRIGLHVFCFCYTVFNTPKNEKHCDHFSPSRHGDGVVGQATKILSRRIGHLMIDGRRILI
jgi:hypothetical protein